MTNGRAIEFNIEGTAALETAYEPGRAKYGSVITLPMAFKKYTDEKRGAGLLGFSAPIRQKISEILESSEMICSLLLEDARGCSYGVFSKQGITAMSGSLFAIATLAIAIAA